MEVSRVLRIKGREVHTVEPDRTVADAIGTLVRTKIRSIVVTEDSRVVGVITARDILRELDRGGAAALATPVRDVMTTPVISVTPKTTVDDAEKLFEMHAFNHLPVLEDDKLVGIITPADVLLRHLGDVQDTNARLVEYISGTYY